MKVKILSKFIVFLLGIRLVLAQFRDISFFDIAGYGISLLSIWSALFLVLVFLRLLFKPSNPSAINRSIIFFFIFVFLFGFTRIFMPKAIFVDLLYMVQFFGSILVSAKVLDDLGIEYIAKKIMFFVYLLLIMHVTASIWDVHAIGFDEKLGNYLGAFESKHIAARAFLGIFPFALYSYLSKRTIASLSILFCVVFFMIFTFERTSILTLLIIVTFFFLKNKQLGVHWYIFAVLIIVVTFSIIPTENLDKFIQVKFQDEFYEAQSGNIGRIGAGRAAIALLAQDWYLHKFGLFEKLFGLGTAQSYMLHHLVGGNFVYAHVQFIQLIIDYGLFGLFFVGYIMFKLYNYKRLQYFKEQNLLNALAFAVTIGLISQLFYAMPLMTGGEINLLAFWLFTSNNLRTEHGKNVNKDFVTMKLAYRPSLASVT